MLLERFSSITIFLKHLINSGLFFFFLIVDGGKNPTFQEKFVFTLIEGLRELNVLVWNSNTVSHDDFIGSGK